MVVTSRLRKIRRIGDSKKPVDKTVILAKKVRQYTSKYPKMKEELTQVIDVYKNANKEINLLKSNSSKHPEIKGLVIFLDGHKDNLFKKFDDLINKKSTTALDFVTLVNATQKYAEVRTQIKEILSKSSK